MRTCIYSPITLTPRQSFPQRRQSQKRLDQNRQSRNKSEERVEGSSLQQNAIVFCVRSRRLVYFFPFSHYVRFRALGFETVHLCIPIWNAITVVTVWKIYGGWVHQK
jgi:hypothetical protein